MSERLRDPSADAGERPTSTERADARWVESVRTHYRAAPLTPARRVAFDRALEDRLRGGRRARLSASAWFGMAACTAAAVALVSLWARPPAPVVDPPRGGVAATAWEWEVFYPRELDDAAGDATLPGEYAVLASAFLDE